MLSAFFFINNIDILLLLLDSYAQLQIASKKVVNYYYIETLGC